MASLDEATKPTTAPADDAAQVQALVLALGEALTFTEDAVSEIEGRLRAVAAAYGHPQARISVFPTLLLVSLTEEQAAGVRTIDSFRRLRLDQASAVIRLAESAQANAPDPRETLAELERCLAARPRFSPIAQILAHGVVAVGLGLVIRPAPVDLWIYLLLGWLVGAMKAWAARFATGGYLLAIVSAAVVSAIAFLAHGGNDAASLRLTIPPLVTFLPGALLTMATVDLAMGETVTGASRFVAGLLQLALLAIGILIGAELVGDPHSGPFAGAAADTLGRWAPWVGVVVFGAGVFVHNVAPRGSLPWLLLVLLVAYGAQLVGELVLDATLSGFVGAAMMVPAAHAVARMPSAPPAHVMFLPAFWLLVPGTIGLIGITELFGDNEEAGIANLGTALASIPSVALGVLVGVMAVRAVRAASAARLRDAAH